MKNLGAWLTRMLKREAQQQQQPQQVGNLDQTQMDQTQVPGAPAPATVEVSSATGQMPGVPTQQLNGAPETPGALNAQPPGQMPGAQPTQVGKPPLDQTIQPLTQTPNDGDRNPVLNPASTPYGENSHPNNLHQSIETLTNISPAVKKYLVAVGAVSVNPEAVKAFQQRVFIAASDRRLSVSEVLDGLGNTSE